MHDFKVVWIVHGFHWTNFVTALSHLQVQYVVFVFTYWLYIKCIIRSLKYMSVNIFYKRTSHQILV